LLDEFANRGRRPIVRQSRHRTEAVTAADPVLPLLEMEKAFFR